MKLIQKIKQWRDRCKQKRAYKLLGENDVIRVKSSAVSEVPVLDIDAIHEDDEFIGVPV